MTTEIMQELEENIKKLEELIENQRFRIGDAHNFLKRIINIYRSMENMEKSRDTWKKKYYELKSTRNTLKAGGSLKE